MVSHPPSPTLPAIDFRVSSFLRALQPPITGTQEKQDESYGGGLGVELGPDILLGPLDSANIPNRLSPQPMSLPIGTAATDSLYQPPLNPVFQNYTAQPTLAPPTMTIHAVLRLEPTTSDSTTAAATSNPRRAPSSRSLQKRGASAATAAPKAAQQPSCLPFPVLQWLPNQARLQFRRLLPKPSIRRRPSSSGSASGSGSTLASDAVGGTTAAGTAGITNGSSPASPSPSSSPDCSDDGDNGEHGGQERDTNSTRDGSDSGSCGAHGNDDGGGGDGDGGCNSRGGILEPSSCGNSSEDDGEEGGSGELGHPDCYIIGGAGSNNKGVGCFGLGCGLGRGKALRCLRQPQRWRIEALSGLQAAADACGAQAACRTHPPLPQPHQQPQQQRQVAEQREEYAAVLRGLLDRDRGLRRAFARAGRAARAGRLFEATVQIPEQLLGAGNGSKGEVKDEEGSNGEKRLAPSSSSGDGGDGGEGGDGSGSVRERCVRQQSSALDRGLYDRGTSGGEGVDGGVDGRIGIVVVGSATGGGSNGNRQPAFTDALRRLPYIQIQTCLLPQPTASPQASQGRAACSYKQRQPTRPTSNRRNPGLRITHCAAPPASGCSVTPAATAPPPGLGTAPSVAAAAGPAAGAAQAAAQTTTHGSLLVVKALAADVAQGMITVVDYSSGAILYQNQNSQAYMGSAPPPAVMAAAEAREQEQGGQSQPQPFPAAVASPAALAAALAGGDEVQPATDVIADNAEKAGSVRVPLLLKELLRHEPGAMERLLGCLQAGEEFEETIQVPHTLAPFLSGLSPSQHQATAKVAPDASPQAATTAAAQVLSPLPPSPTALDAAGPTPAAAVDAETSDPTALETAAGSERCVPPISAPPPPQQQQQPPSWLLGKASSGRALQQHQQHQQALQRRAYSSACNAIGSGGGGGSDGGGFSSSGGAVTVGGGGAAVNAHSTPFPVMSYGPLGSPHGLASRLCSGASRLGRMTRPEDCLMDGQPSGEVLPSSPPLLCPQRSMEARAAAAAATDGGGSLPSPPPLQQQLQQLRLQQQLQKQHSTSVHGPASGIPSPLAAPASGGGCSGGSGGSGGAGPVLSGVPAASSPQPPPGVSVFPPSTARAPLFPRQYTLGAATTEIAAAGGVRGGQVKRGVGRAFPLASMVRRAARFLGLASPKHHGSRNGGGDTGGSVFRALFPNRSGAAGPTLASDTVQQYVGKGGYGGGGENSVSGRGSAGGSGRGSGRYYEAAMSRNGREGGCGLATSPATPTTQVFPPPRLITDSPFHYTPVAAAITAATATISATAATPVTEGQHIGGRQLTHGSFPLPMSPQPASARRHMTGRASTGSYCLNTEGRQQQRLQQGLAAASAAHAAAAVRRSIDGRPALQLSPYDTAPAATALHWGSAASPLSPLLYGSTNGRALSRSSNSLPLPSTSHRRFGCGGSRATPHHILVPPRRPAPIPSSSPVFLTSAAGGAAGSCSGYRSGVSCGGGEGASFAGAAAMASIRSEAPSCMGQQQYMSSGGGGLEVCARTESFLQAISSVPERSHIFNRRGSERRRLAAAHDAQQAGRMSLDLRAGSSLGANWRPVCGGGAAASYFLANQRPTVGGAAGMATPPVCEGGDDSMYGMLGLGGGAGGGCGLTGELSELEASPFALRIDSVTALKSAHRCRRMPPRRATSHTAASPSVANSVGSPPPLPDGGVPFSKAAAAQTLAAAATDKVTTGSGAAASGTPNGNERTTASPYTCSGAAADRNEASVQSNVFAGPSPAADIATPDAASYGAMMQRIQGLVVAGVPSAGRTRRVRGRDVPVHNLLVDFPALQEDVQAMSETSSRAAGSHSSAKPITAPSRQASGVAAAADPVTPAAPSQPGASRVGKSQKSLLSMRLRQLESDAAEDGSGGGGGGRGRGGGAAAVGARATLAAEVDAFTGGDEDTSPFTSASATAAAAAALGTIGMAPAGPVTTVDATAAAAAATAAVTITVRDADVTSYKSSTMSYMDEDEPFLPTLPSGLEKDLPGAKPSAHPDTRASADCTIFLMACDSQTSNRPAASPATATAAAAAVAATATAAAAPATATAAEGDEPNGDAAIETETSATAAPPAMTAAAALDAMHIPLDSCDSGVAGTRTGGTAGSTSGGGGGGGSSGGRSPAGFGSFSRQGSSMDTLAIEMARRRATKVPAAGGSGRGDRAGGSDPESDHITKSGSYTAGAPSSPFNRVTLPPVRSQTHHPQQLLLPHHPHPHHHHHHHHHHRVVRQSTHDRIERLLEQARNSNMRSAAAAAASAAGDRDRASGSGATGGGNCGATGGSCGGCGCGGSCGAAAVAAEGGACSAAGCGGGACARASTPVGPIWHNVHVCVCNNPTSGEPLLVVTQYDVTPQMDARSQLTLLLEREQKILESIFPRHVIEYLTLQQPASEAAVARAGSGRGRSTSSCCNPPGQRAFITTPAGGTAAASNFSQHGDSKDSDDRNSSGPSQGGQQQHLQGSGPCSVPITAAEGRAGGGGGSGGGGLLALQRSSAAQLASVATSHPCVTILFADIVGFTSMSKQVTPLEVMTFLNQLYSRFDAMLDIYRVYKVETIGDCFMVAGGLVAQDEEGWRTTITHDQLHAVRVLAFAKAMLREARKVQLPTGGPVLMRVGIHSGPVMSGVVGSRMPRFCLFGDTVNTASRMECTSQPGRIHVSGDTQALLPNERWEATGGVQVKGKGVMPTYLWSSDACEEKGEQLHRVLGVYL